MEVMTIEFWVNAVAARFGEALRKAMLVRFVIHIMCPAVMGVDIMPQLAVAKVMLISLPM